MGKVCSYCKNDYPLQNFSRRKKSYDGLQSWCKLCYRAYKLGGTNTDQTFVDKRCLTEKETEKRILSIRQGGSLREMAERVSVDLQTFKVWAVSKGLIDSNIPSRKSKNVYTEELRFFEYMLLKLKKSGYLQTAKDLRNFMDAWNFDFKVG